VLCVFFFLHLWFVLLLSLTVCSFFVVVCVSSLRACCCVVCVLVACVLLCFSCVSLVFLLFCLACVMLCVCVCVLLSTQPSKKKKGKKKVRTRFTLCCCVLFLCFFAPPLCLTHRLHPNTDNILLFFFTSFSLPFPLFPPHTHNSHSHSHSHSQQNTLQDEPEVPPSEETDATATDVVDDDDINSTLLTLIKVTTNPSDYKKMSKNLKSSKVDNVLAGCHAAMDPLFITKSSLLQPLMNHIFNRKIPEAALPSLRAITNFCDPEQGTNGYFGMRGKALPDEFTRNGLLLINKKSGAWRGAGK